MPQVLTVFGLSFFHPRAQAPRYRPSEGSSLTPSVDILEDRPASDPRKSSSRLSDKVGIRVEPGPDAPHRYFRRTVRSRADTAGATTI